MTLSWMAWTPQTALFFIAIFTALVIMAVWEFKSPGGSPRKGILGLTTTRGDRLFITLLSSAYVHIFWLWLFDHPLWYASIISALLGIFIFRKV